MPPAITHIRTWIFDLDNTLYPASANLFARIDARMTAYVDRLLGCGHDEAYRLQKSWFRDHGTTLSGLMAEHGVDPHHFLDDVHDIEMDVIEANAPLAAAIARLPGRKLVFTNGDATYAARVIDRLGLSDSFEAIHDIHAMTYRPKPDPSAYAGLCDAYAVDPKTALFADDMVRNLLPAKAIGMATLWIDNGSEQAVDHDTAHIDFVTHDLCHWLHEILEE